MSDAAIANVDPLTLPSLPLERRGQLPDCPAIYFVVNANDAVLYVGQSVSLAQRWVAHHRLDQFKSVGGCRVAWLTVDDESLLNEIERACISHFQPSYNRSPVPAYSDVKWRSIRLKAWAWEALTELARHENRNLSEQARHLIEEGLRREGFTEPKEERSGERHR